ncbi:hypothetical protein BHE74_00026307 [Ensete ventricosum]|nr:hypothetical protein BHE74_00026307 [Ensete ventricosum]
MSKRVWPARLPHSANPDHHAPREFTAIPAVMSREASTFCCASDTRHDENFGDLTRHANLLPLSSSKTRGRFLAGK